MQEPKLQLMFVLTELPAGREESSNCVKGMPLTMA